MRTLLMVTRERPSLLAEAEPVVVDTDDAGCVVLELDDGERLVLDAVELRAAVSPVRRAA